MGGRVLEQERADNALQVVLSLKNAQSEWRKKFVEYAEKLPATILSNGLGQACATLLAAAKGRTDDPHRELFNHLQNWLCRNASDAPYFQHPGDLMGAIVQEDRVLYLRAQAESLAWLTWLKKFAVAYLKA